MGVYIAIEDLKDFCPEDRVIELADGDPETETLDNLEEDTEARIRAAIGSAEAFVNGKLRGRFAIPISPVSEEIRAASAVISLHRLAQRKREFRKLFEDDYDVQVAVLDDLASREGQLGEAVVNAETIRTTVDDVNEARRGGVMANGGLRDF
jgi:phage gp36-like protein